MSDLLGRLSKFGSKGYQFAGGGAEVKGRAAYQKAAYNVTAIHASMLDNKVKQFCASKNYTATELSVMLAFGRACDRVNRKMVGATMGQEFSRLVTQFVDRGVVFADAWLLIRYLFGYANLPPSANAGPDDFLSFALNYTLAGATAANYVSLLWTTSGDGVFNDATVLNPVYTPGVNDLAAEEAFLTLTAQPIPPTVLPAADTMTLDIVAPPSCNAGPDDSINAGDTYPIPAAFAIADSSILWTTSGDGTFDDDGLITATYTPGPVDQVIGSVVLTLTAYPIQPQTVNDVDSLTLTIVPIVSQYTMNAPNGGEAWTIGTPYLVAWISTAADPTVAIEESVDSGLNWNPIAAGVASNIGFQTWPLYTPAGPPCGTTRIRITSESNPINTCESAGDFSKVP